MRQALASLDWRRRCWNASLAKLHTPTCAISAPSQHIDSAFYPIISQMERAAGFAHGDTAQTKLDKLDTLLAQSLTPRQDVTLFAEMLSLPNDGRYPTLQLAPQQRRQRTLEAFTTQIKALAQQSPVLMIFEDAHWADPTSLEALGPAVDRYKSPWCAADRDLPTGFQAALDRAALCKRAHHSLL